MEGWLTDWLSALSLTSLTFFVLASMLAAALGGYGSRQLRRRLAPEREASEHSQESYLIGGMLGVLALLLAFSFSMAVERYEERRHLVVQEANAIGTSYLRAQLLDEPHRRRLSNLLVEYTDNRIALGTAKGEQTRRQMAVNDNLLTQIWAAVTAARDSAQAHGISVSVLTTYNELIDLDTERKVARLVRVPAPVLLLMYAFLLVTAAVLGFVLEERRAWFGACVLFLLLSLYVSIIADLNRPASGNIQESQEPMLMLKDSLLKQPPAVFDRFKPPPEATHAR
jgi:hypothetical protein